MLAVCVLKENVPGLAGRCSIMEVRVSDAGSKGASAPSGFFKGVSFVGLLGVLGTLIAAYFQNLSAYRTRLQR